MNKKIKVFLAALALLFCVGNISANRNEILKVYNWADYIDQALITEFETWYWEQTGEKLKVIYQTFDINEIMLTKIEKGQEDYDVVCPSEYIIERMLKMDILLPIDTNFANTPNYITNISTFITDQLNQVSQPNKLAQNYAVAYMWGTCGLLYNKDFVSPQEVKSWSILWNEKYVNKILLKDSYRDIYGTAALYAYRNQLEAGTITLEEIMNNTTDSVMKKVEELLLAIKPNVAGWEADFGKEMMTKGKAYLNLTWSGDAVWAMQEAAAIGVNLDYYVPEEGSNIWYDGWVIPKYAKNTKAANYFINFMCRPDVAIRNMEATGYVSAIATQEILDQMQSNEIEEVYDLSYFFGQELNATAIHINPVMYPDRTVAQRCTMIRDFGSETEKVLELWSRIKGDNLGGGMILLIVAVIALVVIYMVFNISNKRKRKTFRNKRR